MLSEIITQHPPKLNICVIGDTCTDRTITVEKAPRANPENPDAPLYNVCGISERTGMAFNVFEALRKLTAGMYITCRVGGENVKTRLVDVETGEQVLRYDDINPATSKFPDLIPWFIKDADIIVISDYCKGYLSDQNIIDLIALGKVTFIDTKRTNLKDFDYSNVWFKINQLEYAKLERPGPNKDNPLGIFTLEYADMLVTQGSEGCNNYAQNLGRGYTHLGFKVSAVDVCGAGDMLLAGLVYASTFTTNIKQQLDVANAYAAISVAKAGIYVPTKQELIEFLQERGL